MDEHSLRRYGVDLKESVILVIDTREISAEAARREKREQDAADALRGGKLRPPAPSR